MKEGARGKVPGSPGVRLRDVTIAHRGHPAVHHLSGDFAAGALNAVVGPNGAGKSSLLSVLAGQRSDFEGQVEAPARGLVAYLPQAGFLDRTVPVTVMEFVAMGLWHRIGCFRGLSQEDRDYVSGALAAVGMRGFERRFIGELSAGQAQRALFARVLLQDSGLILLDEPFSAIDARTTADLIGVLKRWRAESRTVIAVIHDLDQVREHFDEVLLLARQCVAWGPTAKVLRAENLFRARQMAESWDEKREVCQGLQGSSVRESG